MTGLATFVGGTQWRLSNGSWDFVFERLVRRFRGSEIEEDILYALEYRDLDLGTFWAEDLEDLVTGLEAELPEMQKVRDSKREVRDGPRYAILTDEFEKLIELCREELSSGKYPRGRASE
jgi:hypothetical protein